VRRVYRGSGLYEQPCGALLPRRSVPRVSPRSIRLLGLQRGRRRAAMPLLWLWPLPNLPRSTALTAARAARSVATATRAARPVPTSALAAHLAARAARPVATTARASRPVTAASIASFALATRAANAARRLAPSAAAAAIGAALASHAAFAAATASEPAAACPAVRHVSDDCRVRATHRLCHRPLEHRPHAGVRPYQHDRRPRHCAVPAPLAHPRQHCRSHDHVARHRVQHRSPRSPLPAAS
jgi:hypothetical protein